MRLIILYYHLFKNAGSTTKRCSITVSAGDSSECPRDLSDRNLLRYMWDEPGALAVSSHQLRYPAPQAFGYLFFDICF